MDIQLNSDLKFIVLPSSRHDAKPFVGCSLFMSNEKKIKEKKIFTCKLVGIENVGSFGGNCPYSMLIFDVNGNLEKHSLSDSKLLSLIKNVENTCFKPC